MSHEKSVKNFALVGVAGFIAPRHLKAIKDTGNNLIAALDKFDQVGIMDSYFPQTDFFTEFERFDRHLDKLKRQGVAIDYVSICTPNYLHDSHIRFALRQGANAICEKPLVLNPWNVDALEQIEEETNGTVSCILQLRHHPTIVSLKNKIEKQPRDKKYDIELSYITSRGRWYQISWKGDVSKSGGIATNIGIHFFDMLIWIFGEVKENKVYALGQHYGVGYLELERATVRWFLSIDSAHLPSHAKQSGKNTYRSIKMDGEEIEFSEGFTDLHTESYRNIIAGKGFGLKDTRPSIEVTHNIRNAKLLGLEPGAHSLADIIIEKS